MDDTQLKQISRYIEKARHELLSSRGSDDTGALLFMGEMQDPIPRTLIIDQTLNAIDVRVWMLLRISIANPVLPGKLPSQMELSHSISSSKMTIWSSMQILRLNRWITLCDKVRDVHGHNRGNIYAIHTEPMMISDTLKLDNSYIDFIEQSLDSKVARVKNNAMAAHIAFYKQINNNKSNFNHTQLQQHDARLTAFQSSSDNENHSILSEDVQNYYAHNLSQSEFDEQDVNLSIVESEKSTGYKNCTLLKSQSIKIVPCNKETGYKNCTLSETAQQSHSLQGIKIGSGNNSSGSSSNIYNTKRLSNTTTTTRDQVKNLKSLDRLEKMILAAEIPIIHGILNSTDESVRQDVLDQILGRLVNYQKNGHGQIYNLVSFSQTLMVRANDGTFTMDSHGLMIQNGRKAEYAQKKTAENAKRAAPQSKKEVSLEERQRGMVALSELKAKMKINL